MDSTFANCSSLTELDLNSFANSNLKSMANLLNNCTGLNKLLIEKLDLNGINISGAFDSLNNNIQLYLNEKSFEIINNIFNCTRNRCIIIPETTATTIPTIMPTTISTTTPTTLPNTIPTTISNTIPNTIPTTISNTIPTTISTTTPTTVPNTISTTIPTTIYNTISTTTPTAIPTTISTTSPTTIPNTIITTISTTILSTVSLQDTSNISDSGNRNNTTD